MFSLEDLAKGPDFDRLHGQGMIARQGQGASLIVAANAKKATVKAAETVPHRQLRRSPMVALSPPELSAFS